MRQKETRDPELKCQRSHWLCFTPPPAPDQTAAIPADLWTRTTTNQNIQKSHISSFSSYFTSVEVVFVFMFWSKKKKIRVQLEQQRSESPVCHRRSDGRVNVLRQPNPDKHAQQTNPRPANPRTNSQNDADCFKDLKSPQNKSEGWESVPSHQPLPPFLKKEIYN